MHGAVFFQQVDAIGESLSSPAETLDKVSFYFVENFETTEATYSYSLKLG